MNVKIKKLNKNAKIPTHGSNFAAGYDLYTCIDEPVIIPAHSTRKIGTGLAMDLPRGYFGAIFPRSGVATKLGVRLANCTAVIDEDYKGEWIIPLHNDTDIPVRINPNERVAQFVLLPYQLLEFEETDNLSESERGANGFGSTGTN